jgi:hypothetical protein
MTAGYLDCVLAGLVPLLLAGALWARSATARPVRVRVTRYSVGSAAHPLHRQYRMPRAIDHD